MNNNNYLIPANSKKSKLIFGFLRFEDLILLIVGICVSFGLWIFMGSNDMTVIILEALPLLFAIFMVAPIPPYHNIRTLIGNILSYYTGVKKYYWRGWCIKDGTNRKSGQNESNNYINKF